MVEASADHVIVFTFWKNLANNVANEIVNRRISWKLSGLIITERDNVLAEQFAIPGTRKGRFKVVAEYRLQLRADIDGWIDPRAVPQGIRQSIEVRIIP